MRIAKTRSLAAALVAAALIAGVPGLAEAAAKPRTELKSVPKGAARLRYQAGKTDYDAKRWTEAGQAWSDVLDQIPENPVNRNVRMNIVLDAIAAYRTAYEQTGEVRHLETALDTYYRYFSVFKSTYNSPNIPRPVVVERFALKEEIERVKSSQPTPPPPPDAGEPLATVEPVDPSPSTEPTSTTPPPDDGRTVSFSTNDRGDKDRTSTGLIIGGAVTMAAGVGASSMIVVGAVGGQQAREDSKNPEYSEEQRQRIDERGRTMNAVFIAGLVATPVLVGAGAAMLGVGLHRRQRRGVTAVAPSVGPNFAGLTLSGRF
jgi:hypothetical protein